MFNILSISLSSVPLSHDHHYHLRSSSQSAPELTAGHRDVHRLGGDPVLVHALTRVIPLEDVSDIVGDVDPLRVRAHDEFVAEQPGVLGPLRLVLDQASVDKINELDGENGSVRLRVEAWRVAVHDLLQLLEDRVPLWVGEAPGGQLDEGDACGVEMGKDNELLEANSVSLVLTANNASNKRP